MGGLAYNYPVTYFGWANQGRIRVVAGVQPTAIVANQHVFLFSISFNRSSSTGIGSCSGCESAICLGLTGVLLTQPAGVGDVYVQAPEPFQNSDMATWQTGAVMRRSYEPHPGSEPFKIFECLSVTEVRRPTWGAIKRMYRR
ncbi:MAG: hypothetical protein ABIS67_10400 [Candidatus Eisenbacteria bacterium]